MPKKNGLNLKFFLIAALVIAVIVLFKSFNIQEFLRNTLDWIEGQGMVGAVVYAATYVLACVLMIPGSILTLGAGAIYGVLLGSILVSLSSTLGATAAFLTGRYLARNWVAQKIEENQKFLEIDSAVAGEGWKIVGLTRLSPIFPFNLLNYAYGLTKVSLRDYFFASWIGMLPGTIMYVYIGSLAGDLASIGAGGREKTTGEWSLYIVGLLATIIVTIYITKIAKAALSKKVN